MAPVEQIRPRKRTIPAGAALAMLAAGLMRLGPALAADPLCPPEITVEQQAVNPPAGFKPFDRKAPHRWVNAEFADGPPEEMAWLAPDSSQRKGNGFTNVWTFGQTGRGTWISCAYDGTSVELTARLPDTVKRCEIRFEGPTTAPVAKALSCR
ncbi:MAG: hypothetical protein JSS43_10010 [Proteobacteria bacterium]|nr:hypothetical protein [Pseudomonadota bacterium]